MTRSKRRTAVLLVLLLLAAHVPLPAQPPRAPDAELAAGIALVREGDFEAAVLKLDTVVRRLLADASRTLEAAQAYVYLGVSFLELGQELVARGKFQEALALDPQLRLDPREFSPQQIRVFEAARAEARTRASASPSPAPARPRSTPAPAASASPEDTAQSAAPEEKKKKRSPVLWIVGGAAVVGAGVAAAAGGGGGGAQPTTTTAPVGNTTSTTASTQPPDTTTPTTTPPGTTPPPTTTPSTTVPPSSTTTLPTTTTTSSTTTTTTTTMPVGCATATVAGPNQPAYGSLGSGFCPVGAPASCNWSAAVVGNPDWVNLTTSSGAGAGQIRFSLGGYALGPPRQATLFLVQNTSASCTITQTATIPAVTEAATALTFTSELDVEGGRGQVVIDGASATFQGRGAHQGTIDATPGLHRVEATVVTAGGTPGTWRFRVAGPLAPGSLRVIAGTIAAAGGEEVVFRLSGKPGERLVFSLRVR